MARTKRCAQSQSGKKPKAKLTKEERRVKYTEIARKRRQKQQQQAHDPNHSRNNKSGGPVKKKFCFQCRHPGHLVAQCPLNKTTATSTTTSEDKDIPASVADDDIGATTSVCCYKCGSTEHSLSTCPKHQKDLGNMTDLPFATCFSCHEKGHLISSCPRKQDTTKKGIYIHGGSCKLCGSIWHLKKHCPERGKSKTKTNNQTKEETVNVNELLEPETTPIFNTTTTTKDGDKETKRPKARVVTF